MSNILSSPTTDEYATICLTGERNTWGHLSRVRTMCQIEFALDRAVRQLRGQKARAEVKDGTLSRVPSFYTSYSTNNLPAIGVAASSTPSLGTGHPIRRNKSLHIGGAVMTL